MGITITKVTGIGGNPPTQILIEGTISSCEFGFVTISTCSTQRVIPIDFTTLRSDPLNPGTRLWELIYRNDLGCSCGAKVKVEVSCSLGMPSGDTETIEWILDCGCCEEVTVDLDTQPLPCEPVGGGTVPVQFSATLSPAGCTGPFEWKVSRVTGTSSTVLQQFTPGGSTFSYQFPGAGTYKVNVRVQQPASCDDTSLTDSYTFTIHPCTACSVTLSGPTRTPCTDGPPTPLQTYTAM